MWSEGAFMRQDHPAVVQVLLGDSSRDVDGNAMPNLIYVAREKRVTAPHHFKAGALNALIRVSAVMSNAPVVLTLDCDMYSNDPITPLRALCHFCDPEISATLAYLQFPQRFRGINNGDIYAGEYQRLYQIQPQGFDGLRGPNYLGSACFFNRRSFYGPPGQMVEPEIPELHPNRDVSRRIESEESLRLAHEVAGCNYEESTDWGCKIGIRYGSLSEDLLTGYLMKCEGWRGNFTYPKRAAFLGDAPTSFMDMLNQQKRWSMGLLQICFSKFSPLTYGIGPIGHKMAMGYAQYAYWPFWSVPIMTYALLPQLAVLHGVPIFPEIGKIWFWVHALLFVGAYAQDMCDFVIGGGTLLKWWNDQRIWAARGISCCFFGGVEYLMKWVGLSSFSFNVTSKVQDDDQIKRYQNGLFEFGTHSAMFTSMTVVAIVNLSALLAACWEFIGPNRPASLGQLALSAFGVLNCWPIYHAAALRNDAGMLPIRTAVTALLVSIFLYFTSSILF